MNALVRKEIRLILPFWVITMLLAILPPKLWRIHDTAAQLYWAVFTCGMLFVSLASFGTEYAHKTFSYILVHPTPRSRIWGIKFGVLLGALLLSLVAFVIQFIPEFVLFHHQWPGNIGKELTITWATVSVGSVATSLWAILLVGQIAAAFWISLAVPVLIFFAVGVSTVYLGAGESSNYYALIAVWTYSLAAIWYSRRRFINAEDTVWTGGNVSLPRFGTLHGRTTTKSGMTRSGSLSALIRKELHLQQMTLWYAVGGIIIHVSSFVARRYINFLGSSFVSSLVSVSWMFAWFWWLALPIIAGTVSVAEERKLGTLEGQLCLPAARRQQYALKLATVLFLSAFLGWGMWRGVEWLGEWFRVRSPHQWIKETPELPFWWGWIWLALGLLAFHASTLSRNTIQAMGTTVVSIIATVLLGMAVWNPERWIGIALWRGWLGMYVIGASLALTLTGIAWWNFKRLHSHNRLVNHNLAILTGCILLTSGVTALAYHRIWELLPGSESQHGPPRIVGTGITKIVCSPRSVHIAYYVLLPDGRLWLSTRTHLISPINEIQYPVPADGVFLGASDWADVASDNMQVVAIRKDGTLWSLYDRQNARRKSRGFPLIENPSAPYRIGSDNRWKKLAGNGACILALKQDGSLWGWGNSEVQLGGPRKDAFYPDPVRLGNESNWNNIHVLYSVCIGTKQDGSIWWWGRWPDHDVTEYQPVRWKVGKSIPNSFCSSFSGSWLVQDDGSLWGMGFLPAGKLPPQVGTENLRCYDMSDQWIRIGCSPFPKLIKRDGTLWSMHYRMAEFGERRDLIQVGSQSDWICPEGDWDSSVALSRDGKLSGLLPDESFLSNKTISDFGSHRIFLRLTRLPIWTLNILDSPTRPWAGNQQNKDQ